MYDKRTLSKDANQRVTEAHAAMSRLRATFNTGDNRFGEYGRNCQEAFNRHAKLVYELTGEEPPSIYYDR